ncbi:MAG: PQQ-binding-like beta-propeller repeat protein [Gemmatimonadaceae bacterium]
MVVRRTWLLPLAWTLLANSCSESTSGERGVTEKWYQSQPTYSNARPAVLASTVFFGTGDGRIIARDVSTGTPKWDTKVGSSAIEGANLIVSNGTVIAPVQTYTVALDAVTGKERWRYSAPNDTTDAAPGAFAGPGSVVESRIDTDGTTAFIPAWGASVGAVDVASGTVRWIWQPGRIEGDTAASGVFRSGSMGVKVSGDTVFATMWHYLTRAGVPSEALVIAINKQTGAEFWRVRLPYQAGGVLIQTAPVFYQNLVIVHTLAARTYAIDRSTQTLRWEFTPPGFMSSTSAGPELLGDQLYIDGGNGKIYALHAADGTQVWSYEFGFSTTSDMLATTRRLLFTQGNVLYILDRNTGLKVAATGQPHTSDPLFASPPAASQGLVFVTVAGAAWCFEEP